MFDTFYIFDWDDTIQKDLKIRNSFEMFFKTLTHKVDREVIKNIIKSDNKMIITTRSILYTFAIKLKCFIVTKDFRSFLNTKVSTINPDFFFDPKSKELLGDTKYEHMLLINNLKCALACVYETFRHKSYETYEYIDEDITKLKV